jgi:hypothetical protein
MASGLPDVDSLSTYGGAKEDYAPVEDYTTDEAAAHRNLYAANVAAMTHTATRAWVSFVGNASSATDPASNIHDAVWGNGVSVKTTNARTGTGVWTLTWPTSVTDELGVSHAVNLRRAWASVEGSTPYLVTVTPTSSNVLTVRIFNTSGTANDAAGVTINVFAV